MYSENREQMSFLTDTFQYKFNNFMWTFCIFTVFMLFISESKIFNVSLHKVVEIMFVISILLIVIMTLMNFMFYPSPRVFINYENLLRSEYNVLIHHLNQRYLKSKVQLNFRVSSNDLMWIEIYIPEGHRMPYNDF